MKKYNVTFDLFRIETIYEVEANNKKEAIRKAKLQSEFREGEFDFELFEIKEVA
jgi:hypothetical protein